MFAVLRYVGTYKRRISWNSMGKAYSYVVSPGQLLQIPYSQMMNAKGAAPFEELEVREGKHVRKVRRLVEKESTEVVTESDEDVFEKQDKLNPFDGVETDGTSVEIKEATPEPKEELFQADKSNQLSNLSSQEN